MKVIAAASLILATVSVPSLAQQPVQGGTNDEHQQGMAGIDHSKMEMMMKPTPANT